jgi:hypothetical protein
LANLDAIIKRVESHRPRCISPNQVTLNRSVGGRVELDAPDRDADVCPVDNITSAGCGPTNYDPGTYLHIDPPTQRADRCRPRCIGAYIVALD